MSAAGRWFITPHAVERYIERHRPELGYARALGELVLWSEVATERCPTVNGHFVECHSEFPAKLRFVVSYASACAGTEELPVLVTALPKSRRPRWVNLPLDVALEFRRLENQEDKWNARFEQMLPRWLAERRVDYAMEKRANSIWYRTMLAKSRQWGKQRTAEDRALRATADRLYHTVRRNDEVSTRPPCPECGNPIALTKRMGRVRKFCSVQCTHRAAGRDWWYRKNGKPSRNVGTRGGKRWTPRELELVASGLSPEEVATQINRSAAAVRQKRVSLYGPNTSAGQRERKSA